MSLLQGIRNKVDEFGSQDGAHVKLRCVLHDCWLFMKAAEDMLVEYDARSRRTIALTRCSRACWKQCQTAITHGSKKLAAISVCLHQLLVHSRSLAEDRQARSDEDREMWRLSRSKRGEHAHACGILRFATFCALQGKKSGGCSHVGSDHELGTEVQEGRVYTHPNTQISQNGKKARMVLSNGNKEIGQRHTLAGG